MNIVGLRVPLERAGRIRCRGFVGSSRQVCRISGLRRVQSRSASVTTSHRRSHAGKRTCVRATHLFQDADGGNVHGLNERIQYNRSTKGERFFTGSLRFTRTSDKRPPPAKATACRKDGQLATDNRNYRAFFVLLLGKMRPNRTRSA
jgi:hypothetical protein